MNNNNIRLAQTQDVDALIQLMNTAYRSNVGWTHEQHIVAGERINQLQIQHMLESQNIQLYVLVHHQQLIACIGLTFMHNEVEIGSFAVAPNLQNSGYGKVLLEYAEQMIRQHSKIKTLSMSVLSVRHELIAYYERRGYVKTGRHFDYPINANVGIPLCELNLIELQKAV
jgi:ribosomal protein S18 acetylase RimI-like enzyme